ncbi:3-deoxy-manno-octulosonate cytidylyltransferase [Succinatimonas hippei]|uniref:3-deoxy-manno-octulosonate cytidylyltransferase n=1 Tax=Succinatimonas hippei TaxID=626938 RepID=UPI0020120738|nr:3-deoxy-manno-octulosonate cytidylyltransferase [Succinatimonas hippei]MCL1603501.1 3-deoxy-manno-octulosonate cytidylyltransferase [Succinatimonas hippei]
MFIVAIPSRYSSTRLPGKPLCLINGKPMVKCVCERALKSNVSQIIVCIDDFRVEEVLKNEPVSICYTSKEARSGTERIAEMIKKLNIDPETIIVNVQGDEPLIEPEHINSVAELLQNTCADMATLCARITDIKDVFDPNCVKVVMDQNNFALYFSRAPIPYERDNFRNNSDISHLQFNHYHHIGIYAYKAKTILDYLEREQPEIERCESLEQLRLLHYGMKIAVAITDNPPECGVDTPEDLVRVNEIIKARETR